MRRLWSFFFCWLVLEVYTNVHIFVCWFICCVFLFCLYLFTVIKTSSRMPGNQFINVSNEQTDNNNRKRNMNKELRKLVCIGEWGGVGEGDRGIEGYRNKGYKPLLIMHWILTAFQSGLMGGKDTIVCVCCFLVVFDNHAIYSHNTLCFCLLLPLLVAPAERYSHQPFPP